MTPQEREEKILANTRIIHHILHKTYIDPRAFYDYEDLYQEGVIGLMEAVDNFNPDLGYEFSTYAFPMVRGKIMRFIRDNSNTIHYARSDMDAYVKITRLGKDYSEISKEELEELGITPNNLAAVISMIHSMSLDDIITNKSSTKGNRDTSVQDLVADASAEIESYEFKKDEISKIKDLVLSKYNMEDERDMIDEFFYSRIMYMPINQNYLGSKYGIRQATVSRHLNKFLILLKTELQSAGYDVSSYMKDSVCHNLFRNK